MSRNRAAWGAGTRAGAHGQGHGYVGRAWDGAGGRARARGRGKGKPKGQGQEDMDSNRARHEWEG